MRTAREPRVEGLLRQLGPQVLGALARRHGQFEACEDATQEALLAATEQWPKQGVPDHPRNTQLPSHLPPGNPSATSRRINAQSSTEITHPICLGGLVFDRR